MIQSIGNNFGCKEIVFNDFQNEKQVVLNGKFVFSCHSEEFKTAQELDVYLPETTLPASGISGCFIMAQIGNECYCTTICTWIKDRNTVCFEKLDPWSDNVDSYMIFVQSIYVPKGQRQEFICKSRQPIKASFLYSSNGFSESICYVDDNWAFLGLSFSSFDNPYGKSEEITLESLPSDIDGEILLVGDDINCSYLGVPVMLCTIKDGKIIVPSLSWSWGGMPSNDFFFYGVRLWNNNTI